jgi:hypothetical protein
MDMSYIKIEALPLLVIALPVEGGKPGEVAHTTECPHCHAQGLDIVREIDEAVRWNTGELVIENGQIVAANWGTGGSNFHHSRYECEHCGNPVELPGDISEDWS